MASYLPVNNSKQTALDVGQREGLLPVPVRPTMEAAITGPILRAVVRQHGIDTVTETLLEVLVDTLDMLECQRPKNSGWMRMFVTDWMAKYDCESIEDFALFLSRVRRAEFGPLYNGRIDGTVLFGFYEKHLEHKADEREAMHTRVKQAAVRNTFSPIEQPKALPAGPTTPEQQQELDRQEQQRAAANEKLKQLGQQLRSDNQERRHREADARNATLQQDREAHIARGMAALQLATTTEQFVDMLLTYPDQAMQQAVYTRAEELGVALPTPDELIWSVREDAAARRRKREAAEKAARFAKPQ